VKIVSVAKGRLTGRLTGRLSALASVALFTALNCVSPALSDPLNEKTCQSARSDAFDRGVGLTAQPMTIVAVGSSSTEGVVRNAKNKIYPAAMQTALLKLWPQANIQVVNKGKGGETMRDMIARFENDVIALKPTLVIWQLGVNDVLRYQGTEGRHEEIQAGLKSLTDKGIPVILLDLQYAPMVIKDPDTLPMQAMIDDAVRKGPSGRVLHFKRFAMMKQLSEKYHVPMSDMTDTDDLHMTDAMHSCVGQLLADMVVEKTPITLSGKP
jgi:acyl-CoA thioesterase I